MILVSCPHCDATIEIAKLNCCIFRHGVIKSNRKSQRKQIPPHASEKTCKRYIDNDLIDGCGKPFKLIIGLNNEYIAEKCDYI